MQPSCNNSVHCSGLFQTPRQSHTHRSEAIRKAWRPRRPQAWQTRRDGRGHGRRRTNRIRFVLVRRPALPNPGKCPIAKKKPPKPAAVASPVDLNDLDSRSRDSRSSDSRSTRRRIMAREASAGFVNIRRPAETPPAHELWTNLNAPTKVRRLAASDSSWDSLRGSGDSLVRIEAQRQKLLGQNRCLGKMHSVNLS